MFTPNNTICCALLLVIVLYVPLAQGQTDQFAECREALADDPGSDTTAKCVYKKAIYEPALLPSAIDILAEQVELFPDYPWSYVYLGRLKSRAYDPEIDDPIATVRSFDLAARMFLQQEEPVDALDAWLDAVERLQGSIGEMVESQRLLDLAADLVALQGLDDCRLRYFQINQLLKLGGDLGDTYRQVRKLKVRCPAELPYETLSLATTLLLELGRYEEGRMQAEALVELAISQDDYGDEANARGLLAYAHESLCALAGAPSCAEARREYELGLQAARKKGWIVHRLLYGLAKFETPSRRRELLEECVEVTQSRGDIWYLCRAELAAIIRAEDPDLARKLDDEILAAALEVDDPWFFVLAWHGFLELVEARWPKQHLGISEQVLELVESIRESQLEWRDKAQMLHTWAEPFNVTVGKLLQSAEGGDTEALDAAFRISEWLRARVLLEAVGTESDQPQPGEDSSRLAEMGRQAAMLRLQGHLAGLLEQPERQAAYELTLAAITEEAAERRRALDLSTAHVRLPDKTFAELEEVRRTLADSEAMLLFQLAPESTASGRFSGGSWLTVIRASDTRVYRLPNMALFGDALSAVLSYDQGAAEPLNLLKRLYDDLLAPAIDDLPANVRHLIVVPDGALHLLPFALLRPDADSPPLVERYRISLAGSATLWLRDHNLKPKPSPAAALVLADPVLPTADATEPLRQWIADRSAVLGPLPAAREEGQAVLRHLGPNSRLLVGQAASESTLASTDLSPYSILHFATHARAEEVSGHSGVLLAEDSTEDGLLTLDEITELPLDGQLVVLATCSSAAGEGLRGEGVMSLARAFFAGGARTLISSLRPLSDSEALAFFDRFYAKLASGESVGVSFHEVQRELIAAAAPPGAWSHLVLMGDTDWVPVPRRGLAGYIPSFRLLVWLVAAALLGTGSWYLWRVRQVER